MHPDAVLVSGDLSDSASDAEYEQLRDLLSALSVPLHALVASAAALLTACSMNRRC
jgi:3',5'-cyclic AMP phosphodiesterase CpdA